VAVAVAVIDPVVVIVVVLAEKAINSNNLSSSGSRP
jgi:hypothetical protein